MHDVSVKVVEPESRSPARTTLAPSSPARVCPGSADHSREAGARTAVLAVVIATTGESGTTVGKIVAVIVAVIGEEATVQTGRRGEVRA